ncbi:hypothetical protein BDZ45DRAFT_741199 [Acephala macrosclerotiorum]|nr:hypothetical protein BDZ45DRAFT_741199 [Acephala macrosclerotiorum]
MSYTNFKDAAASITRSFTNGFGTTPPEKVYGMPKYCGVESFREVGEGKTYWVVLWRQGGINPLDGWQKTLRAELEDLMEKGECGGTAPICEGKWRFEKLDRFPPFRRSEEL